MERIRKSPAATGLIHQTKQVDCSAPCSRCKRLLLALVARVGVSREQADRLAHASNSPDLVFQLRKRGVPIQTRFAKTTNLDGESVRYGIYFLDANDKTVARQYLRGCGYAV